MIDANKLLESISDEEIIEILIHLGCEKYKEHRNNISFHSICHNGSNLSLIYFRDSKQFRCFSSCACNYNIYSLVQKINDYTFPQALKFVSDFVGREYEQEEVNEDDKVDDWNWIKKLKKKKYKVQEENITLSKNILQQFIHLPHIKWINESINHKTQLEWDVFYHLASDRICYGIYDENNNLLSVKGRSVDDEVEPKYLYLYPINKNNVLTGLNKTLPYILEEKKCLVFESFKSVMLSWQYGYKFSVSLEGSNISDWQYEKLIKLGVEVIFCYDKGLENDFLRKVKEKFKNKTELSFVFDKWGLLDDKMSPVDEGKDIWEKLYNKRFKVK